MKKKVLKVLSLSVLVIALSSCSKQYKDFETSEELAASIAGASLDLNKLDLNAIDKGYASGVVVSPTQYKDLVREWGEPSTIKKGDDYFYLIWENNGIITGKETFCEEGREIQISFRKKQKRGFGMDGEDIKSRNEITDNSWVDGLTVRCK